MTRRGALRRGLPLFASILASCAATAESPRGPDAARIEGGVLDLGRWVVGCSNLGTCTAIAPLGDPSRLEDTPHVLMVFTRTIADAQTIAIMRGDAVIDGLSPLAARRLTTDLLDPAAPPAAHPAGAAVRYTVPREGFAEVTEVLARWRTLPPRPRIPTKPVMPLPASRIDNPPVPQALARIARRCPQGHEGQSLQAWRGRGGGTLWRVGCGSEGLNPISFWFASARPGGPAQPVRFEDRQGHPQPFNSWFDEATGYLRMTHYFGRWDSYAEDCGIYRVFAWQPTGMTLVERREMPVCGTGISPEGWITTYRAAAFDAPDSGP